MKTNDSPYTLSAAQITTYQKKNHIKLPAVFSQEEIGYFNRIVSEKVNERNQETRTLKERDTYGKAFLQLFNLWTHCNKISALVFNQRLAKIAADLMQVDGVRLYHDQALFKEAGGGITPWHADQYYWPMDTDKTITAWIPLQAIPLAMGPLEFSSGSQKIHFGRDMSISDESEAEIGKKLRVSDFEHVKVPFDAGDVSFHSGWVFHRAGANTTQETRKVMTVIYVDQAIRLKKPENEGQMNDWKTWCPGVKIGDVVDSHLNPTLYSR